MRSPDSRAGAVRLLRYALLAVLAAASLLPNAAAAPDTDVIEVKPEPGGGVRATARVTFPAKPSVIHAMLTDYAHWPELFDVRMRMADIAVREGVVRTDVRIEHALLPGERRLVGESRILPDGRIVTDLVEGDFKRYHRAWTLTPVNGGAQTHAEFELIVAIDSIVPDWLVALAMRRELEAHFKIVKDKSVQANREK